MAAGETFQIGDIVQLKSGGPKMTVTRVHESTEDNIQTSWFAGSKRESGFFPPLALIPITDESDR